MTNREAVIWLINVTADIGKTEHRDLWHYEQALSEIKEMLESQPERKKGRWMQYHTRGFRYMCSECHSRFTVPYCYCPHCGSFNREGEMEVDG